VLARRPWRARAGAGPQCIRRRAWPRCRRLAAHPLTWPGLAGLVLGLLALGPALAPGYILSYDMVFLPHAPISAATIGLAGGAPRAVPSDAVMAALSAVIPADLLQKIILVAIVTASCAGAARLLGRCAERAGRPAPLLGRLAAGVFYAWNPYVAERVIIGHWALLLGYAGLPWVITAAWGRAGQAPRPDQPATSRAWLRSAGRLGAAMIPALVGGYAAVGITALTAIPVALADRSTPAHSTALADSTAAADPADLADPVTPSGPAGAPDRERRATRVRRLVVTVAVLGVAGLPWMIPSLLVAVHTDPAGADAFAARPDTPFGAAGSLLMLGGIWNAQVIPRGYGGAGSASWLVVVLIAVAAYVLLGWRRRPCPGLGIAALAGFLVAAAGVTGPTRTVLRHLIAAWPGFGVLRDGQQFIAPLALAEAIGLGLGVVWLITGLAAAARGPDSRKARPAMPHAADAGPAGSGARGAAVALAVMAVIAPVIVLPELAWGVAGRLHATAYPADWLAARRVIDAGPRPGSVVLLPWAAYRRFSWNDGEAVLDPWTKLLARPVIWNDALQVGALTVAAEDRQARRLTPVIAGARSLTGPLRAAGVRYVVVDAGPLLRGLGSAASSSGRTGHDTAGGGGDCLAARARLPGATVVLASADLIVFRLPAGPGTNPAKGPTCPAIGR
jgi:hypothetical protein